MQPDKQKYPLRQDQFWNNKVCVIQQGHVIKVNFIDYKDQLMTITVTEEEIRDLLSQDVAVASRQKEVSRLAILHDEINGNKIKNDRQAMENEDTIRDLQEENQAKDNTIQQREAKILDQEGKIMDLDTAIGELKQKETNLTATIATKDRDIKSLQNQVRSKNEDIADLKSQNAIHMADKNAQIEKERGENFQLQAENFDKEGTITQLTEDLKQRDAKIL